MSRGGKTALLLSIVCLGKYLLDGDTLFTIFNFKLYIYLLYKNISTHIYIYIRYRCVCVCVFKSFQSCLTLQSVDCNPPGSSVHGISRQNYCNGLPFSPPWDLPDPRIEPESLWSLSCIGRRVLGSPICIYTLTHTHMLSYKHSICSHLLFILGVWKKRVKCAFFF